jgi:50S ribosomal subunit-associated GTPase HflX
VTARKVIIVGLFSAKDDGYESAMRELETSLRRAGNLVVGSIIQRRGVSRSRKPGGAHRMDAPMDAATYIGRGKAEEVAELRRNTEADLVVVHGSPSSIQLARLQQIIGCEVVSSH